MTDPSPSPLPETELDALQEYRDYRPEWMPALRIVLAILAVGCLVLAACMRLLMPEQPQRLISPLLTALVAALSLWAYQTGRIRLGRDILTYGILAVVAVAMFISGGVRSAATLVFAPLIISASVISRQTGERIFLLSGGLLLAMGLAEYARWLPAAAVMPWHLHWLLDLIVLLAAAGIGRYLNVMLHVRTHHERDTALMLEQRNADLAARERQLRLIAENIPAFIFHGDRDLRCRFANRRFAEFYGCTQEGIIGKSVTDILGQALSEAIRPRLEAVLSGELVRYRAERRSAVDGEAHQLDVSFVPERDESGAVVGYYALVLDVTAEVRAEQALHEQHAFQDAMLQAQTDAGLAMFIIEAGKVVYANVAACRLYGYSPDEMKSLPSYLELAHPEDRERIAQNHQRRLRGEKFENSYRIAIVTKSGERREADLTAAFMPGPTPRVLVILVDATERSRAEAALRESEARLREAQRIGHVGSWEFDVATRQMTWSDEMYRIYERKRSDFEGTWQSLLAMAHPDDVRIIRSAGLEATNAKDTNEMQHRILTPDGRTKHIHVRFEVFRNDEGKSVRALGTVQDITEQVLARAEIEHLNERLEVRVRERTAEMETANKELESFAYSISHDLRAPLRGIDGFSHLLDEEYGERLDEQGRGYLKRVRGAAQRMGALIDDILELSRVTRRQMVRKRVDLSRMAADILDEFRQAQPQRSVDARIEGGIVVEGDPQLLRVMMQNLIENAWKYSGKTDQARIEFGREADGATPCLFVRDNGAGFDMRYAGRLFAPFQRLHKPEEFEGTGIGLATVARVVHRHGGRVWAEAEPGQGATFRFTLGGANGESGGQ